MKKLSPMSKCNINLSCRERWFRKSRKSWNLGLQSSDQVDGGAGTEEVKMYPRKVQIPPNSSYSNFRWKDNRWCSTYPTTLSPCSCLLYLRSCHRGATHWQIHYHNIPSRGAKTQNFPDSNFLRNKAFWTKLHFLLLIYQSEFVTTFDSIYHLTFFDLSNKPALVHFILRQYWSSRLGNV